MPQVWDSSDAFFVTAPTAYSYFIRASCQKNQVLEKISLIHLFKSINNKTHYYFGFNSILISVNQLFLSINSRLLLSAELKSFPFHLKSLKFASESWEPPEQVGEIIGGEKKMGVLLEKREFLLKHNFILYLFNLII